MDKFLPSADLRRQFRSDYTLGDGLIIGAASWLRPGKQLEHLIEVAAGLPSDVTVVMAGGVAPGEEQYAKELMDHAQRKLGPRLRFVGRLDDLRGFYNALDLYVNTSQEEAFGLSVLESMACGCPVVGYPSGAVIEVVGPDAGEIVPQDDAPALLDAVDRWLGDETKRNRARLHARRQAEDRYDIRRLAYQLWDEYQSLLAVRS
jgi:glycosyltransferase involved in cell wall biosynthesis